MSFIFFQFLPQPRYSRCPFAPDSPREDCYLLTFDPPGRYPRGGKPIDGHSRHQGDIEEITIRWRGGDLGPL
jgi:hypothetical protein